MIINFPYFTGYCYFIFSFPKKSLIRNEVAIWRCRDDIYKQMTEIKPTTFNRYLDTENPYRGFLWKKETQIAIPGEIWKTYYHNNDLSMPIEVSSEGRVKASNNILTYGSEPDTGYKTN